MPSYDKNIQDAAKSIKKSAAAKARKKSAVPKSPKPVVPKLGAMPKAPKSSYPKSPKAGPVGPKMGRPLPAAGSGKKVALKKY